MLLLKQVKKISSLSCSSFRQFSSQNKKEHSEHIPAPQHPTMAESVGLKMDVEDLKKLFNPTGFLSEKEYIQYEGIDTKGTLMKKIQQEKSTGDKIELNHNENKKSESIMEPEFGFKVKGPEPTRFGDWERKGRCSDF